MWKGCSVLLLCVSLTGCAGTDGKEYHREFNSEFDKNKSFKPQTYTPLPYHQEDGALETVGKSLVNVPVWTLEAVAFTAVLAAYFWAVSGFPTNFR